MKVIASGLQISEDKKSKNIWKCKNREIEYGEKTLIMAVINVTPDSFSDGGKYFTPEAALQGALQAQEEGADIIDVGAFSTRPGHSDVSEEEEWRRLDGALSLMKGKISLPVSVDTFRPEVARKALGTGVCIINDVSGEVTPEMAAVVKSTGCGWVVMYAGAGGVKETAAFFEEALKKAKEYGVPKGQICLDMGIGFGKTRENDFELLANVKEYKVKGCPLLLGVSRKRVVGVGSRQEEPALRTPGNIAADTAAILSGADIIRLHDVKTEKQGIYMADMIKRYVISEKGQ